MTRAKIVGMGAYAPKRVLSNADLEAMVETSDEWIVQRTGIRERRIAEEGEATSDLAVRAAQQALERANLVPEDIDFIVVGTTTPDMFFPTTANLVQHRLGCRRMRRSVRWPPLSPPATRLPTRPPCIFRGTACTWHRRLPSSSWAATVIASGRARSRARPRHRTSCWPRTGPRT